MNGFPSARSPRLTLHLGHLCRRHLQAVLAIEQLCHRYPDDEQAFVALLSHPSAWAWVAELDGRVVGYLVFGLGVRDLHLHNLAVLPAVQRRGVGRALVESLVQRLGRGSCFHAPRQLVAHVADLNLDAQLFFRSLGFECSGILRNHFDDPVPIDAFTFVYRASAREEGGQP